MDLVLKKTFYQSRVVLEKLQSRNRDACSQTVVIVDTIQIEIHSRGNWTACCKVRSFRDNFQCKLFSRLGNPFGNFDEPFERVSKLFARSC